MFKGKYISATLVVVMLFAGMIFLSGHVLAGTSVDQKKAALDIASKNNGVPSNNLEIVDSTEKKFPSGKAVSSYKVQDKSGNVYSVTVDDNGKEVNIEKLMLAEIAAQEKINGKFDTALTDKISKATAKDKIRVVAWIKEKSTSAKVVQKGTVGELATDERTADEKLAKQQIDERVTTAAEQAGQARITEVKNILTPVVAEMNKKGINAEADSYVPVVYFEGTPTQIKDVSNIQDVETIYLDQKAEHTLNIARPTIRADVVYNKNIAGWGVKVGEIEVGGQASSVNPYLAWPSFINDPIGSCLSDHSTAVAGMLKSTNPTYFGIAPGMQLRVGGSCLGFISELTGATDRARTWGARIVTNSWANTNADGNRKFEDRYFDSIMFNPLWVLPVIAAGNTGGRVTSPGLTYNGITVGAFDDRNTLSWSDDVMASFSGWINPNNGMEKPEVAAPGVNFISTTTSSPWIGSVGSGTSYATPLVTGEAALLLNRNSGLSLNPEATKSIIMATAVHNIEGNARLSGMDGAGGIVADRADNVAKGINGNWGEIAYTCSSPTVVTLATMPLIAGIPTRAVMAFSSNPTYAFDAFDPSADLDIKVLDPFGHVVASSLSFDNTYEIVSFTPTVTGNYQLKMNKFRCSSVNWVGWAWYRGT